MFSGKYSGIHTILFMVDMRRFFSAKGRETLFSATVFVFFGIVLWSCGGRTANRPSEGVAEPPRFTPPTVPVAISDPAERISYLAAHWWDNFDFADTTCIHTPEVTEQAFVDFLEILPAAGESGAHGAIRKLLGRARSEESGRVYAYFLELAEKYLYDANSPFRNEELYVPFVECALSDPRSGEVEKIRPAHQLAEINKNRRGRVAADFTYTLAGGRKGRLHAIGAEYTVLYFYNPDCTDCKRTTDVLLQSRMVSSLVDAGLLKILAFFPDEDTAIWESYRGSMPGSWINARDGSKGLAVKNELYSIRAIPSLYLLDREKRVILKDATAEQVIAALEGLRMQ